jgi:hypothetical protein
MHSLIYILVETASKADAISEAEDILTDLCGGNLARYGPYDSYTLFQGNHRDELVARWRGTIPPAAPIDSDTGREMVEDGWRQHKQSFHRDLDTVAAAIDDHSRDELMASDSIRTAFQRLGARRGPPVTLYDQFADGIRSRGQLDIHLDELTDGDRTGWVVPADVHH